MTRFVKITLLAFNSSLLYLIIINFKIGELNVQLLLADDLKTQPLWIRNTQHGDLWLRASVTIPKSSPASAFRIVFEGIVGSG